MTDKGVRVELIITDERGNVLLYSDPPGDVYHTGIGFSLPTIKVPSAETWYVSSMVTSHFGLNVVKIQRLEQIIGYREMQYPVFHIRVSGNKPSAISHSLTDPDWFMPQTATLFLGPQFGMELWRKLELIA